MSGIKLLPCPFCGKSDTLTIANCVELEECKNFEGCEFDGYKTICCDVNKGGCGAASGYAMDESLMIEKWNMREGNRMSDDLISRKAIKANIEAIRDCWAISPYVTADDIRLYANVFNVVLQCISDCPIAFDQEKVIKELYRYTAEECELHECGIRSEYCNVCMAKKAIEIIEKGGIE